MSTNSPSTFDAMARVVVLAFDLVDSQISALPKELATALQRDDVARAIKSALLQFAIAKQKSGTTVISDKEESELLTLVNKGGKAVGDSVLTQLKATPEFKKLEQGVNQLKTAWESSPLGVWCDKRKGLLIVVGVVLAVGGGAALFVTKTSALDRPISLITGKDMELWKVGRFSLKGQFVKFEAATRTLAVQLNGTEELERIKIEVQLGVVASGRDGVEAHGQVIFRTPTISVGASAAAKPSTQSVDLGLNLGITSDSLPGPLQVGIGVAVRDGQVASGTASLGMQTKVGSLQATGTAGQIDASGREGYKMLATWTLRW